jgi:hypothetical protein
MRLSYKGFYVCCVGHCYFKNNESTSWMVRLLVECCQIYLRKQFANNMRYQSSLLLQCHLLVFLRYLLIHVSVVLQVLLCMRLFWSDTGNIHFICDSGKTPWMGEQPIANSLPTQDNIIQIEVDIRECIQKSPDWVDNEINNKNKHSLRSNTKGYGGKTH